MFNIHVLQRHRHVMVMCIFFFVVAATTFFSNSMARRLAKDEQDKMRLWAEAYRVLDSEEANNEAYSMAMEIIRHNETIPLLVTDDQGHISSRNIKLPKRNEEAFLKQKLQDFKNNHENPPIEISFEAGDSIYTKYIYYGRSILLKRLSYFPFWQVLLILFFMSLAYFLFSLFKRSEENRVWVGLSKETAHQLGTPISSLLAWIDLLRSGHSSESTTDEMEKDVARLQKVANRFSKIGSMPTLEMYNLNEVLEDAIGYMSSRITKRVSITKDYNKEQFIPIMLNSELFEWVVENLIKNAVDAMRGGGVVNISLKEDEKSAILDFSDEGKGIPKNKFNDIFTPGVSSKKRGWGLGLSFAKRIIKDYHKGKIFVKKSEINVGTTFRIILPKCKMTDKILF